MNKSYSKIRHIQETNTRLEKRFLNEQARDIMMMRRSEPSPSQSFDDPLAHILRKTPQDTKREQIQDIIDNFESINCDDFSPFEEDMFPENVSIYCQHYRGKTKEDMIDILNNI